MSSSEEMAALLHERLADVCLGPRLSGEQAVGIQSEPIMRYRLIVVAGPSHRMAGGAEPVPWRLLADDAWLVDPSAADPHSEVGTLLRQLRVPDHRVRVFASQAGALAAAAAGEGVAPAISHLVTREIERGALIAAAGRLDADRAALVREHARGRSEIAGHERAAAVPRHARGDAGDAPQRRRRPRQPFPPARLRDALELSRPLRRPASTCSPRINGWLICGERGRLRLDGPAPSGSPPGEDEIDGLTAGIDAALLEPGDGALDRSFDDPAGEPGLGRADGEHLRGVVGDIGGDVKGAARYEAIGQGGDHVGANESAVALTDFRPRVGEEDPDLVQDRGRDPLDEDQERHRR